MRTPTITPSVDFSGDISFPPVVRNQKRRKIGGDNGRTAEEDERMAANEMELPTFG